MKHPSHPPSQGLCSGGRGPGDGGSTTSSCNTVCEERKERRRPDTPGWGCKVDGRSLEGEKESDARGAVRKTFGGGGVSTRVTSSRPGAGRAGVQPVTLASPQEDGVQVTSDHVHHSQGRLEVSHDVSGKHSAATWRVGWGWAGGGAQ